MEVRKSIKHVPTYEKTRDYTNFERYKTFDIEGFFADKKLKVVEVLSTKPLKLLVEIEEDNTIYPPYQDGNVANNTGRLFRLYLDTPSNREVQAGQVMRSENPYVEFDFEDSYVKVVSYEKLFVYTGGLVLIDREQENLKEFYSGRD